MISPVQSNDPWRQPRDYHYRKSIKLKRICRKGAYFKPGVKEWGWEWRCWQRRLESRQNWTGWRDVSGSWFQTRSAAYLNERFVFFNEDGWWARSDNRWGAGTATGLKRDQIVKIGVLSGSKNFVNKTKQFIFETFIHLNRVEKELRMEVIRVKQTVCQTGENGPPTTLQATNRPRWILIALKIITVEQ